MAIYETADEIETLVKRFEDTSLAPGQFNHAAHLTVAAWYLAYHPFDEAVAAMRTGVKAFAAAHGHDGLYHETITLFWMKVVWGYMVEMGTEWDDREVDNGGTLRELPAMSVGRMNLPGLIDGVVTKFGDARLMFEYYSRERLFSAEARAGWVEPDLRALFMTSS